MTTRSDVNSSIFVLARDNVSGQITRLAVPFDMQVGTQDNPSELQLHGRFSFKSTTYRATSSRPIRLTGNDTIASIKLAYTPSGGETVDVYLPSNPQRGQLQYILDTSATATSFNVVISSESGYTISGEASYSITTNGGGVAVFWNDDDKEWSILSSGGGGGGGDTDASYVVMTTETALANERVLTAGTGISITDGGAGNAVTIENTQPGDLDATYVVMSNTTALPNERMLVAGDGMVRFDTGAGGTVGLSNVRPGDIYPTYLLLSTTASLPNERAVAQGLGIKFLDGGAHSDFTIFIDNNVVATISGSRFTGPVLVAAGLTGSHTHLLNGQTFIAPGSGMTTTTSSAGQITISLRADAVADPGASYLVLGTTASLSNERQFVVGTDLSASDGGAGGSFTLYNPAGFDRHIPTVGMYLTGSLTQQRVLSAGNGIVITDFGAGNAVSVGLEQFTSMSTHAFQGHCTGSLNFSSADWADLDTVFLGSFTDDIVNHVERVGSTLTVARDGIYFFAENFNVNLTSGSHIAFRVTSGSTTLLQHTSWQPAGPGQPSTSLNGLLSLTSGSSIDLQYATLGSAFEWPTPGSVGGASPEDARTGEFSLFLVADPIVVSQSFVTNNNTVTGSGWITACDVNFAASSSVTVVNGAGNVIGDIAWTGVNILAGADSVANVPGDGLRIDTNSTNTDNGITSNTAPQVKFRLDQVINDWNLDDVEVRIWAQFNTSASSNASFNAAQVELARTNWANDSQNYSFRSLRYHDGASAVRAVRGLYGSSQAFAQTHAQDHNIIIMHWRNPRACDFFSSFYNGGHMTSNELVWPNISSTFYRGQGDLTAGNISPTWLTGSGDLSFVWSAYTQNNLNNMTASLQRLKVEYRRGVGTGGGGSGGGGGGGGGGGDPDAAYLVAVTTGSLSQQRLVVAGPGITINDGGANSIFAISASGFTPDADMYAKYLLIEATASLPNERVLRVGTGLTMSDAGAGSNALITNTHLGDLSASYVVLGTNANLLNERVLTAGANVTITDGGAGSTVTIAVPAATFGADPGAQYIVFALTNSLPNERRLVAGTGISLTDGGVGGNLTISTNADTTFADVSASYVTLALTTSLPNERRLTAGTGIAITDAGAGGNVTITATEGGGDRNAQFVVLSLTGSLNAERVLTAGPGITISDNGANNTVVMSLSNFPADVSASYLVVGNTASLPFERQVVAGYGITFEDGGANSNFIISIATGSVAPPSASYVVMALTGALPNERVLTAGPGIAITDNGANNTVVIQTDGTGFGDRAASYVVLNLTGSLDNERVLTAGSGITLTDNGPGSSIVISSTGGGGGSRFPDPDAFFIYAGIKTSAQQVWEAIGAFEFTPDGVDTMAPSGSTAYQAFFQPILEVYPSGTLVAARLYNIGTASEVVGSVVTGSSLAPEAIKSTNLSGSLQTGQNLYEMQIVVSSSLTTPAYVICKGAKLNVIWL